MKKERIRCVISGQKRFELTEAETQFISLAEQNLNQNVLMDKKMESILELRYCYWAIQKTLNENQQIA